MVQIIVKKTTKPDSLCGSSKRRRRIRLAKAAIERECIANIIEDIVKPKRPVLSLKPTKHYPSEDNCCLPNVAIYAVNGKTSDKLTVNV